MRKARSPRRGRAVAVASVESVECRRLLTAVTPSSPVLVFSDDKTGGNPSHTDTLTITNSGSTTLTFSGSGGFAVVRDPNAAGDQSADFHVTNASLPTSLAPGAAAQITVNFTATTANTIESALLQINSSDPAGPTIVQLHGLGTNGQFGTNEPSLANVLTAFDIPTNIGVTDPSDSRYPLTPAASSQEVPLQTMMKAGGGPVTIQMLASFNASAEPSLRVGYYTPGNPSGTTELFTINNADDQTVNPVPQGTTSFDPGSGAFGLYANFPGIGATDTHYSETALNTPLDLANPQKFRFFPLENADGSAVPNAYVVAAEDFNGTAFHSFTNLVAIIRNVQPVSATGGIPVSFGGKRVATYADAAGHKVTLRLSGPGTGQVTFVQGNADSAAITLANTTAASTFTISVAGGTTSVGSIDVTGSLARLSARTTQLQGDLQISGSLGAAQLAGASGGHTLSIGSGRVANLSLGQVADLSINSAGPIGTLQASSWTVNGGSDVISAPSVARLVVTGDFAASLNLTGTGTDLGSANVRGTIAGQFRSSGSIGAITAAALMNADIFAGVDPAVTQLPASAAAFVANAKITSVTITGRNQPFAVQNSNIAASSLGRVTFGEVNSNNGGVPFGLAAHQLARYTRRVNGKVLTWTRAKGPSELTPDGDAVARLL